MSGQLRNNNSKNTSVINDKIAKTLQENGVVVIRNLFSKEECEKLAADIKSYSASMNKDAQCPKSLSVHSQSLKPMSEFHWKHTQDIQEKLGVPINPSYAYARIYVEGEVLKPHIDRRACEISATITLTEDEEWPIFVETRKGSTAKVVLHVGDAAFYYGQELSHWREEYTGKEQIQVFLHWVSSRKNMSEAAIKPIEEGKPIRFDTTEGKIGSRLGIYQSETRSNFLRQIEKESTINSKLPAKSAVLVFNRKDPMDPLLRSELDDTTIKQMVRDFKTKGRRMQSQTLDKKVSSVRSVYITVFDEPQYADFFMYLFNKANDMHFKYKLWDAESAQLCEYHKEVNGKYDWHRDSVASSSPDVRYIRKLSLSILLTPKSQFKGGDLQILTGINSNGTPSLYSVPLNEPGDYVIFNSDMFHRVTPVTAGTREAMVTWCHGPQFV